MPAANHLSTRTTDAGAVAAEAGAVDALFDGRLDALCIRGLYPPAAVARVVARLEARVTGAPWLDQQKIVLVGTPLTPNYADAEGPPLDEYLATAALFGAALPELFAGDADFEQTLRAALAPMLGGKPLEVPRAPDGRSYALATIRGLVPGSEIIDHFECEFLHKRSYAHISTLIDCSDQISYFMPLAVPDRGGELRIYHRRWNDSRGGGRGQRGEPTFEPFHPGPGDLILFAGGRNLHGVSRVEGDRIRWTLGGFLAPSIDRTRWYCFS